MDGREPLGISYTPSYVGNQRDLAEFNRWYKEVHFVDVVKAKVLMNPIMFHNTLKPLPAGADSLIIMYELYDQDPEEGTRRFQPFQPKLRNDYDQTKGIRSPNRGQYRVVKRLFGPQLKKRSNSMYVERLNLTDEKQATTAIRWYTEERLPALMLAGLFHTGSFGTATRGAFRGAETPTSSRFLGLFESSTVDAPSLLREVASGFPLSKAPAYLTIAETLAARRDSL